MTTKRNDDDDAVVCRERPRKKKMCFCTKDVFDIKKKKGEKEGGQNGEKRMGLLSTSTFLGEE